MSDVEKLLVHIGLPKTATTTMQECLFTNLQKKRLINYIGITYTDGRVDSHCMETFREIVEGSKRFKRTTEKSCNLWVYSEEKLSIPKSIIQNWYGVSCGTEEIAKKTFNYFNGTFNNIEVLIVLRNQSSLIHSFYIQAMPELTELGKELTIEKYVDGIMYSPNDYEVWDHYKTVNAYVNVFGKENVHVLLFEDFLQNKTWFVHKLSNILDIDEASIIDAFTGSHKNKKQATEKGTVVIKTKVPRLRKMAGNIRRNKTIGRILSKHPMIWDDNVIRKLYHSIVYQKAYEPSLSPLLRGEISNYYNTSNKLVADICGIDEEVFRQYGYII